MKESFKKLVNYNCNESDTTDVIFDGPLKNDLKFNYGVTDFNQFHFSKILYLLSAKLKKFPETTNDFREFL